MGRDASIFFRVIAISSIICGPISPPAAAQSDTSIERGNAFYRYCRDRNDPTWRRPCEYWIIGAMQALYYTAPFVIGISSPTKCIPPTVTYEQVLDILLKTLREKPEGRNLPTMVILDFSLGHAFPCPE